MAYFFDVKSYLSRAAGYQGHDQQNDKPYQRIIGIAWEGDVGSTNFYGATLNAITAGRRLATVLHQLVEEGLTINLMSHSLGARVVLTALNVLADTHQKAVDHVFLWQPAVADNTLSNRVESDAHPFGAGVLPQAHEAAKRFVILHSRRDGVLDGHHSPFDFVRDAFSGDLPEMATGLVGGAYRKKWWNPVSRPADNNTRIVFFNNPG